jgi:hypothetical protein
MNANKTIANRILSSAAAQGSADIARRRSHLEAHNFLIIH